MFGTLLSVISIEQNLANETMYQVDKYDSSRNRKLFISQERFDVQWISTLLYNANLSNKEVKSYD
jgi:hypothetical protein